MKAALFANTPAQTYFVEALATELRSRGHGVEVLIRETPDVAAIAAERKLGARAYTRAPRKAWKKILKVPLDLQRASSRLRQIRPDVVFGFGMVEAGAARRAGIPAVCYTDTEARYHGASLKVQYKLLGRWASVVVTPTWFRETIAPVQIRVGVAKERAYLGPGRFVPRRDPDGLGSLKLDEDYAIIRLSSFQAVHDLGHAGLSQHHVEALAASLGNTMRVWISFEGDAPDSLRHLRTDFKRSRIHDVLYHARLLVADSTTMAVEAAVLGTASFRFTTRAQEDDFPGMLHLEDLGLIRSFRSPAALLTAVDSFVRLDDSAQVTARTHAAGILAAMEDPIESLVSILERMPAAIEATSALK